MTEPNTPFDFLKKHWIAGDYKMLFNTKSDIEHQRRAFSHAGNRLDIFEDTPKGKNQAVPHFETTDIQGATALRDKIDQLTGKDGAFSDPLTAEKTKEIYKIFETLNKDLSEHEGWEPFWQDWAAAFKKEIQANPDQYLNKEQYKKYEQCNDNDKDQYINDFIKEQKPLIQGRVLGAYSFKCITELTIQRKLDKGLSTTLQGLANHISERNPAEAFEHIVTQSYQEAIDEAGSSYFFIKSTQPTDILDTVANLDNRGNFKKLNSIAPDKAEQIKHDWFYSAAGQATIKAYLNNEKALNIVNAYKENLEKKRNSTPNQPEQPPVNPDTQRYNASIFQKLNERKAVLKHEIENKSLFTDVKTKQNKIVAIDHLILNLEASKFDNSGQYDFQKALGQLAPKMKQQLEVGKISKRTKHLVQDLSKNAPPSLTKAFEKTTAARQASDTTKQLDQGAQPNLKGNKKFEGLSAHRNNTQSKKQDKTSFEGMSAHRKKTKKK